MLTTKSYLNVISNWRHQFYLVTEDYISAQEEFKRDLLRQLETFAANSDAETVIHVPFAGSENATYNEIQNANWDAKHADDVFSGTPGLLYLTKPLRDFDPRRDEWVYFSLSRFISDGDSLRGIQLGKFLKRVDALIQADKNLFEFFSDESFRQAGGAIMDAVSLKPGALGISIDLKKLMALMFPNR